MSTQRTYVSRFILSLSTVIFLSCAQAATFTVNTTDDSDDGVCDLAHCSLREAIHAANASPNSGDTPDNIVFSINPLLEGNDCRDVEGATVCRIKVTGPSGIQNSDGVIVEDVDGLPVITEAVIIDGSIPENRPNVIGYPNITRPSIEISGENTVNPSTGIMIASNGSTIRGLIIHSFKGGIIEGFGGEAIVISWGAQNNKIQANYLAVDAAGRERKPTDFQGVLIIDASGNVVGGEHFNDRNVSLGGRGSQQFVVVWGKGSIVPVSSVNNVVQNNYCGLNVFGEMAETPASTCIILSSSLQRNVGTIIKNNKIVNIRATAIAIIQSEDAQVIDNEITYAGQVSPTGILVFQGTQTQGGLVKGNIIKNNGGRGIAVLSGATGVSILNNSIYNNTDIGISLGTQDTTGRFIPTLNDLMDLDTGPNNLQNYPILDPDSSLLNNSLAVVKGSLNSTPYTQFLIQVFSSKCAYAHSSGYGEGQVFIGEHVVTTDANGNVAFSFPANQNAAVGSILAATATNLITKETSEFSPWINARTVGQAAAALSCQ